MKKTAMTTVVGFAIGILCILFSIMGAGHLKSFFNLPSIFITFGGTLGAVVVSFPSHSLKKLGPVMKRAFIKDKYDLAKDIETIVELSEIARRKGTLALEEIANEYVDDVFLHKGLLMLSDGVSEENLVSALQMEIRYAKKRHKVGHSMMDMIASSVTSLGLLGTYIGLIPMLENLEDPTKLGPMMALELVTSFYGAFLNYVVFAPMSRKLKVMSTDEALRKEFLIEGLVAIQDGRNPKVIKEELLSCLSRKELRKLVERHEKNSDDHNMKEVA